MRSSVRLLCCLVAFAASTVGCVDGGSRFAAAEAPPQLGWQVHEPPTTTTSSIEAIDEEPRPDVAALVLADLTVEEKVGQLFMPVVSGSAASDVTESEARNNEAAYGYRTPAEIIDAYHLGGVMYLRPNIRSAEQLGVFSADLQTVARSSMGIGLLVAVDQEGGTVNRITDGVTVFPPAALLSGDSEAVLEAGYLTGRQVSGQGVNVVLAPVADLTEPGAEGAIGNRSYGDDPDLVADMVTAAIGGLQGSGVAAAVKHWPGHGATEVDSHFQLPVLGISREIWEGRERVPFEAAIDEGVAIVMVGHLVLPSVDPTGVPATISPILIEEQLRGELGFDGVVMTDSLTMGAVDDLDPADLVVQSLKAGADIMLFPEDLPASYERLLGAVSAGEVTQEQLDAAVLRVLTLKDELGLLPLPDATS